MRVDQNDEFSEAGDVDKLKGSANGSISAGHFKVSEIPRTGGSMVGLLEDVIKVGQVMGFKMDGSHSKFGRTHWKTRREKKGSGGYGKDYDEYWCVSSSSGFSVKSDIFGTLFNPHGAHRLISFYYGFEDWCSNLGGCRFTWCLRSATKMSKLDDSWFRESVLGGSRTFKAVTIGERAWEWRAGQFQFAILHANSKRQSLGLGYKMEKMDSMLSLFSKRVYHFIGSPTASFNLSGCMRGMFHGIDVGGLVNLSHMFYADDAVFIGVIQILESLRSKFFNGHEELASFGSRVIKAIHGANGKIDEISGKGANSCWINIIKEVRRLEEKGINLLLFMKKKLGWTFRLYSGLTCGVMGASLRIVSLKNVWGPRKTANNITVEHLFCACNTAKKISKLINWWWDVPFMDINSYGEWRSWIDNVKLPKKNKSMFQDNVDEIDDVAPLDYRQFNIFESNSVQKLKAPNFDEIDDVAHSQDESWRDPVQFSHVAEMVKKQRTDTWHIEGAGLQRFVQMTNWKYMEFRQKAPDRWLVTEKGYDQSKVVNGASYIQVLIVSGNKYRNLKLRANQTGRWGGWSTPCFFHSSAL
ncbi:hypothetical protein Tco_1392321 [Tanacetum coccineum]